MDKSVNITVAEHSFIVTEGIYFPAILLKDNSSEGMDQGQHLMPP